MQWSKKNLKFHLLLENCINFVTILPLGIKKAANKTTKYSKNTIYLILVFDFSILDDPINYSNITYENNLIDKKSIYNYITLIGNGTVTWLYKKRKFTIT